MKENWKHCGEVSVISVGSTEVGHKPLRDQTTLDLGLFSDFQSEDISI